MHHCPASSVMASLSVHTPPGHRVSHRNFIFSMIVQGHSQGGLGALASLLGKRSNKIDPFTPLISRIFLLFCIYLTLFNIIIPKNFCLTLLGIILYHYLITCPCIFKTFAWSFKDTNMVIPYL